MTASPDRPSRPRRKMPRLALILALLLTLIAGNAMATDWSVWRGPDQNGRIDANAIPEGALDLEVIWNRELGSGYSGISVLQGHVLTMYGDGTDDVLVALAAETGKEVWSYRIGPMTPGGNGSHAGPLSTPVSDGKMVYGTSSKAQLFAVNLTDGKEAWNVSMADAMGAEKPFFGFTSTPVLVNDLVVVQAGGDAGLVAFDRQNGEMRWKAASGQVDYRSPILATLGGKEQIVVPFKEKTFGVDPASGDVLWSLDYESAGSATPLVLNEDHFLLSNQSGSTLFKVNGGGVTEVWQNSDLKGSFATPVLVEDKVFGFNRNFLTAVNMEDGERAWRSRPPGGRGIIAVDGRLVVFGANGSLVVADASAGGYTEAASAPISDDGSYTAPTFAEGHFFVRNLTDIAAVRPKAKKEVTVAKADPTNAFETFVRRVEGTDHKDMLIRQYMSEVKSVPIVEGDNLVHFVYWGKAEDVAIAGTMADFGSELSMNNVEGTDFYYRSFEVPTGGRWEYHFVVDFENRMPDPLNPHRVPGNNRMGDQSELNLSGRTAPSYVHLYDGDQAGRTESFNFKSELLENEREITVYLPHGYDDSTDNYPVVVVQQGDDWMQGGQLTNTLNHVIGDQLPETVAVFVSAPPRTAFNELQGRGAGNYADMLANELRSELHERYRLAEEKDHWVLLGRGDGAGAALYAGLKHPDAFGHAVIQSYSTPGRLAAALTKMMEEAGEERTHFAVHWNQHDFRSKQGGWDVAVESRELAETLRKNGFKVSGGETPDGGGWGSWRVSVVPALAAVLSSN